MKTYFIVNPKSAGGKTGEKIHALKSLFSQAFEFHTIVETSGPGHATELTREAIQSGYHHIFSVGGDGTFNEIVNGYIQNDKPINPDVILSILPAGTGGDFRRNFNLETDFAKALKRIANAPIQWLDCGKCSMLTHSGEPITRYFDNVASLGVSDLAAKKVNQSSFLKKLGGTTAYLLAGISSIISYKKEDVHLKVDDLDLGISAINLIAIANGKYFGGGMKIAPHAKLSDGLFDLVLMSDLSTIEMLLNNGKVYYGGHLKHPKVKQIRGKKITIESNAEFRIELDGETPGKLPALFEVLPNVLRFK